MQTLYNTPEKRAARPWAPTLNWVVITSIYILAAVAVYNRKIIFAAPPADAQPEHIASMLEVILVAGLNVAIAMTVWGMTRRYTGPGPAEALLPQTDGVVGGSLPASRVDAVAASGSGGGYLQ